MPRYLFLLPLILLATGPTPSPLPDASLSTRGVLNPNTGTTPQFLGGSKWLISDGGIGGAEVVYKLSTTTTRANMGANAYILQISDTYGGAETSYLKIGKNGINSGTVMYLGGGFIIGDDSTSRIYLDLAGAANGGVWIQGRCGVSSTCNALVANSDRTQPADSTLGSFRNGGVEKSRIRGDGSLDMSGGGANTIYSGGGPLVIATDAGAATKVTSWSNNGAEIAYMTSSGQLAVPGGLYAYNGSITVGFGGIGVGASTEPMVMGAGWGLPTTVPAFQFSGSTVFTQAADVVAVFQNGTYNTTGNTALRVMALGRIDQYGTDTSGTPGAATINRGSGISAIASGSTTVVITNSLVSATSRVMVTWHGDHGAARWWVTRAAGSFTVTLSAAASANTTFSWEVASLL